jgi:hypothetical protein
MFLKKWSRRVEILGWQLWCKVKEEGPGALSLEQIQIGDFRSFIAGG